MGAELLVAWDASPGLVLFGGGRSILSHGTQEKVCCGVTVGDQRVTA